MKEAIKAVLNLDYETAKNDIRYGRNGNGALGEPDTGGEAGRQTGATDARLGKRGQTGEWTAERGSGIAGVGGEVRERIDGLSGRIAAAEGEEKARLCAEMSAEVAAIAQFSEMRMNGRNVLVSITIGKNGSDVDFNIISSVFGKGKENIVDWINKGYAT